VIGARMRLGVRWSDVCILNLSSRGLMARSAEVPQPGSYVEMRRGCHIIVARVVWTDDQRFGAMTQDVLPLDQIVHEPQSAPAADPGRSPPERRQSPRRATAARHEQSRQISRAMEFGFILFCGLSIGAVGILSLQQAFARPQTMVTTVLGGPAEPHGR
jgi:hypothetical protein